MARKKKETPETEEREQKTEQQKEKTQKEKKKTKENTKKETNNIPENTQPELNIGMVGHVDHGKTTLVKVLSGKWADTHSEEMKRGITIRLGYADVTIYKCKKCDGAEQYTIEKTCKKCGSETEFKRKISLVDAPGHESLMATMLCGANIIDAAILLISATETCPQPQTREHLQALEIIGMEKVIIVQNKIDMVSEEKAQKNYEEIKEFIKGTKYENTPIIPISALHNINVDVLLQTIQEQLPTPKRDINANPIMYIARSFDINKPGTIPNKMTGGIIGGALKQGKLINGSEIEILPGYEVQEKNQKIWKPLKTKITTIMAGNEKITEVHPGGTFAIMTELDPNIVKSDKLTGSVVVLEGQGPTVWYELKLETNLLERVVGSKDKLVVDPIKLGEVLMLNVNSSATVGIVKELGKNQIKCTLKRPVCANEGSRVTMSRNLGQRWRLIGYGLIKK